MMRIKRNSPLKILIYLFLSALFIINASSCSKIPKNNNVKKVLIKTFLFDHEKKFPELSPEIYEKELDKKERDELLDAMRGLVKRKVDKIGGRGVIIEIHTESDTVVFTAGSFWFTELDEEPIEKAFLFDPPEFYKKFVEKVSKAPYLNESN